MADNLDFEQTFALGKRALGYIKYNSTPAIPRNYELWYTYALGFNQHLLKAIQEILDERGRVSHEDAERLYKMYISPERLSEQAENVSLEVSDEIKEIIGLLKDSAKNSGQYGEKLEDIGGELDGVTTATALKTIVNKLATETAQMAANSRQLESQLEESQRQITELSANLETIRKEAVTDQLTGIPNRKHFDERLDKEMAKAEENGTPLCLILTDIDHFKKFNDTYGHQTGDQVLKLVANTLKSNIKGRDLTARYGGEEFAIILSDTEMDDAMTVADQLRVAVMKKELIKKSTNKSLGNVTLSLGISQYRPGDTAETLIHRSDAALYAAKGAGRNTVKNDQDPDVNMSINAA